jgi:hypothetical protein
MKPLKRPHKDDERWLNRSRKSCVHLAAAGRWHLSAFYKQISNENELADTSGRQQGKCCSAIPGGSPSRNPRGSVFDLEPIRVPAG